MIGVTVERRASAQVVGDVYASQRVHAETIAAFHQAFYAAPHTWGSTTWCGVPMLKTPCDVLILQELVHRLRPALIIETGTAFGGTALYLAHLLDQQGQGEVVTIDVENPPAAAPQHPRIRYVRGSSTDRHIVTSVQSFIGRAGGPVLVILDSDHHAAHVAAELEAYAPLVTRDSYLIVEDTNVNGHPVLPAYGPGPHEAVEAFLATHPEFERDLVCERYLLTFNPGGWLRRRS